MPDFSGIFFNYLFRFSLEAAKDTLQEQVRSGRGN